MTESNRQDRDRRRRRSRAHRHSTGGSDAAAPSSSRAAAANRDQRRVTIGGVIRAEDPNDHSLQRNHHHPLPSAPVLSTEEDAGTHRDAMVEEDEVEIEVGIAPSSTVECDSFETVTAAPSANDSGRKSQQRQLQPQPQPPSPTTLHECSKFYTSLESIASRISRLCANLLFATWLLTGLPLLLLLPCAYDNDTKQMRHGPCHPMILLISFSWLINASLALLVLHVLGYLSPGITPWEAAALGWSLGVSLVTYLQASLDGKRSEAMHCIMLRPFGIHVRPGGEGNTVGWFPSLVGAIPGIVFYFLADWFGEVREELQCEEADVAADGSEWQDGVDQNFNITAGIDYTGNVSTNATLDNLDSPLPNLQMICPPWAIPSQDGTLCCHVENLSGNWLEFSAYLAGSVLAGWAVIRFVALFLIWGDEDIELEGDIGGNSFDGTEMNIRSRSCHSMRGSNTASNDEVAKIREVLIAFSRGKIEQSEIEYMLRQC